MISLYYLFETKLDFSKFKLVTSNINKLNEFKRFGLINLNIESGKDLREVDGSDLEVIIYKSLEAGNNCIVEDTSLDIENANVGVNVRWLLNNLYKYHGKKAKWKVLLGLNTDNTIYVYEGVINGRIIDIDKFPSDAFGFDPIFVPINNNLKQLSLYQLEKENKKDLFSARRLAIDNLIQNKPIYKININKIKNWTGSYQH